MSYLRMGDSGLVDPDVIDLTNDPELLGGANALNQKTTAGGGINRMMAAFSTATNSTPKKTPKTPKVFTKSITIGTGGQTPTTSGQPSGMQRRTFDPAAVPSGMQRRTFDPAAVPSGMLTSGVSGSNKWLLIAGGALVVGGIAFFAMRKRS